MKSISFLFLFFMFISCSKQILESQQQYTTYESKNLIVIKLSENVYQHISYLQTNDFGKVPCNGMIVVDNGEAAVFDTPADAESSEELIEFLQNRNMKIKSVVATHFHEDCIGGLDEFHKIGVPSYANHLTIELLKDNGKNIPQNGIDKEFKLKVGNKKVYLNYFGEGHTKDNITAYFPDEKTLFGGCLLKEMDATKGYLCDANESAWSETVTKLKQKYPDIQTVIPGHGERGGMELVDYTIGLFRK
ncbi:subclass B1 metallo-beta-lactamase [Moheibacter sediminis]|uniref:beta-lactamase n=1 Tax=Moheibacter sediminis TaxID=1434700 RepID=A0A1W1ZLJ4_9FLAO|nr:subclass B1 metallo-beta-lactamase [Moheibacter sediminis]SMC48958.1 metallo-beta-lactamase class B [Moheibacter sediminis]